MRPRSLPIARPRRARHRLLAVAVLAATAVSALPALATTDDCPNPLVSITPDGSNGDVGAVAVTSQMLEQGHDGWAEVGWETFGDTSLDSVTIVHSDGETIRTDDLAVGTATDVQELIFCGSTEGR